MPRKCVSYEGALHKLLSNAAPYLDDLPDTLELPDQRIEAAHRAGHLGGDLSDKLCGQSGRGVLASAAGGPAGGRRGRLVPTGEGLWPTLQVSL